MNMMKKVIVYLLVLAVAISLAACGQPGTAASPPVASDPPPEMEAVSTPPVETPDTSTSQPEQTPDSETAASGKTLVVYYSATGSTQKVAGYIADTLGADQFELVPAKPYTSDDLSWTTKGSRVNLEHDDESLRDVALMANTVENWSDYDRIFVGYPIWWGIAAWPVNNFVKSNDFTGKTVIPFCTSSSSGLGESGQLLADMAGTGNWQTGMRFTSRVAEADVTKWVNGLGV